MEGRTTVIQGCSLSIYPASRFDREIGIQPVPCATLCVGAGGTHWRGGDPRSLLVERFGLKGTGWPPQRQVELGDRKRRSHRQTVKMGPDSKSECPRRPRGKARLEQNGESECDSVGVASRGSEAARAQLCASAHGAIHGGGPEAGRQLLSGQPEWGGGVSESFGLLALGWEA